MKKILFLLLAFVLCLSLCACDGNNEARNAEIETTQVPTEAALPREVLGLDVCIDFLKEYLKNPSSLEVLAVRYVLTNTVNIHYEIEYTAENSFGGADRDTIYMTAFVTFPTENSASAAQIDNSYKSRTESWGITDASVNARDRFNEYISNVQTMDDAVVEEAVK